MMSKIKHYYQCDMYSTIGKQLQKYWDCIIRAASRADDYARKYGASSYEAPVQYFEGGVDYLIFDHTPDLKVWRKKITDAEGTDLYEPNCMYRSDVLVMPDDRFHPSDTWDKTYSKEHLAWKERRNHLRALCGVILVADRGELRRAQGELEALGHLGPIEQHRDDLATLCDGVVDLRPHVRRGHGGRAQEHDEARALLDVPGEVVVPRVTGSEALVIPDPAHLALQANDDLLDFRPVRVRVGHEDEWVLARVRDHGSSLYEDCRSASIL